jgi:hypothetical protein
MIEEEPMANRDDRGTAGSSASGSAASPASDWATDRQWWEQSYRSRPYATADRGFEFYEPGYRYGHEAAQRYRGRSWNDVEADLQSGWDRYEHRGAARSTWENVKDAVRDAWDRVTGADDADRARGTTGRTF